MSTYWSPKPMRPSSEDTLFPFVEAPTVVKGLNAMQVQRLADGTPHTRAGASALRPPEPELVMPASLINKGSLVEKYDSRPKPPKQEPADPMTVVKSYLAFDRAEKAKTVAKSEETAKSIERMTTAIKAFAAKTGA